VGHYTQNDRLNHSPLALVLPNSSVFCPALMSNVVCNRQRRRPQTLHLTRCAGMRQAISPMGPSARRYVNSGLDGCFQQTTRHQLAARHHPRFRLFRQARLWLQIPLSLSCRSLNMTAHYEAITGSEYLSILFDQDSSISIKENGLQIGSTFRSNTLLLSAHHARPSFHHANVASCSPSRQSSR
jgi:hypothetical protein